MIIIDSSHPDATEPELLISGQLIKHQNNREELNWCDINFENGNAVITFSIATNSYYTNAYGEQVQKMTWHDCKKFVRQVNAKFIEMLTKGATVTILGTLSYDEYDKEVTKTKSVKIKRLISM